MPEKKPRPPVKVQRATNSSTTSMEDALVALIKRNEELVSLNKSKDEFIAITSHQLRTPATAVKQYLALVLEGYAEPLSDNQRLFLERAFENNERQLRIVDDILRVAQLDLDKLNLIITRTDLRKVLHRAIETVKNKLDRHQQTLELIEPAQPVWLRVDAENLRLAFENILENASIYSDDGKKITVKLQGLKNNKAKITVIDEGIGINESDLPKLFQKFSRLNNPSSKTVSGTGLGLYFSKKILDLHGGNIKVRSAIGKGTIFSITI